MECDMIQGFCRVLPWASGLIDSITSLAYFTDGFEGVAP